MPQEPSSRRSLLHCFARGSFALGSKLFSGLAVQTLGICLLGAGLGNRFLVGLAHLSHRRGLTRWRLCKGRSQTHHKRQEHCANEGEPFRHDRHPPFADNPNPDPKVMISFCLRTGAASIRASPFQLFVTNSHRPFGSISSRHSYWRLYWCCTGRGRCACELCRRIRSCTSATRRSGRPRGVTASSANNSTHHGVCAAVRFYCAQLFLAVPRGMSLHRLFSMPSGMNYVTLAV